MRESSHEFRAIAARQTGMSPNAYQTEHDLLREVLRRCLVAKMQSPRGAEGLDQMVYGRLRRWIHYSQLTRWTVGAGAGRVGVLDG